ncbi:MAG: sodium/proline symporter [Clostridia bacterium]|nr:sodium/proline symporter [Clostridia bacterium]
MEKYFEIAAFALYFLLVLGVGIYFFLKSKGKGEKDYFLGGRNMNGLVAAFSAGASDMSAWVLMGLPGAIYLFGLGQVWISIGLLIGTVCAWLFVAPRLRRFAIKADDAITIPQFFSNRFKAKSPVLRIACAVIFVIAYCVYTASSLSACGTLFETVLGVDPTLGMVIAAVVILVYTLLGGFNAVCWTDFFQGLIMLAALMIVPIITLFITDPSAMANPLVETPNYYSFLSSGSFDWASISDILSGLGWGLGYFGMPHILVRYMSIRSEKEMKKSQIIGIGWFVIIVFMATLVGIVGRELLGNKYVNAVDGDEDVIFIDMVRNIFSYGGLALIGGLMLSAIVAAAMSTADSQLLASSSSFASDIYKTAIKKNASDKEMLWVGRIAVAVVLIVALFIALNPASGGIMALVESAWAIFGAAFGPAILLSLFWRRFNYKGAVSGIITGFVVSVFWMFAFNKGVDSWIVSTNLYELVPGFVSGLIVCVVVTLLTKAPSEEVLALYDSVGSSTEEQVAENKENA